MNNLTGEYDVKLDDKGRLRLPTALLRQIGGGMSPRLVLNRGFEKCLLLYPVEAWEKKTKEVNQLNLYNSKERTFVRYFYRGATELTTDASDRILIPKSLLEYANIQNDIIMLAYIDQVEIWSKQDYLEMVKNEPADFSSLADELFGHKDADV